VANSLIQLIEAAELLRKEPMRIAMIGEGMERKMLLEEVQKRGLEGRVQMLPPVSKKEVFRYILAADAGVSVLKNVETFTTVYSNKTFDYMACARPVMLGIDGISRKLVETARCGTFAEPENAAAIAGVLRTYAANPALAAEHGRNGYAYALQNFDRNVLALRYLGHLRHLTGKEDPTAL
jgi:glycosyltransferase involved in cell wall biosynthesis